MSIKDYGNVRQCKAFLLPYAEYKYKSFNFQQNTCYFYSTKRRNYVNAHVFQTKYCEETDNRLYSFMYML